MAEFVYRIARRKKGSDDAWVQDDSWMSRSGRPYTNAGIAKGEATRRANRDHNWAYEYRVESAVLSWEPVS